MLADGAARRVAAHAWQARGAILEGSVDVVKGGLKGVGFKNKDAADVANQARHVGREAFDAVDGLRSTVFGDQELQAQKEKNAAQDYTYEKFCADKKLHKDEKTKDPKKDPYEPPIGPETILQVIKEAREYLSEEGGATKKATTGGATKKAATGRTSML